MASVVAPEVQEGETGTTTEAAAPLEYEAIIPVDDSLASNGDADNTKTSHYSSSEIDFYKAVEIVVNELEKAKKEDIQVPQEIVTLADLSLPSVETIPLLLNHIYLIQKGIEPLEEENWISKAMEDVLEGLNRMKRNNESALRILYRDNAPPTLFMAMKELLHQANVNGDWFRDEMENGVDPMSNLEARHQEQTKQASDQAESFDIADISDNQAPDGHFLRHLSTVSTDSSVGPIMAAAKTEVGLEEKEVMYDGRCVLFIEKHNLVADKDITFEMSPAIEDKGDVEGMLPFKFQRSSPQQVNGTDLVEKRGEDSSDDSAHYENALQTIEALRMNLQLEANHEKLDDSTLMLKSNVSKDASRKVSNRRTEMLTKMLKRSQVSEAARTGRDDIETVRRDEIETVTFDWDNAFDSSDDSDDMAEDEASKESEETEATYLFARAVDSMLNTVLGPCYLSDESSLTCSYGSGTCYGSQSDASVSYDSSSGDESGSTTDGTNKPTRVPPDVVLMSDNRTANTTHYKSGVVGDAETQRDSGDDSTWWIRDVSGDVDTESLTSF